MESKEKTKGKFIKENLRFILLVVCTLILIVIIENIFDNEIHKFDMAAYSTISNLISPKITNIMKFITELASAIVLCIACALIVIFIKNKKYGWYISLNLLISTILNLILKNVFERQRPEGYNLIQETGFSFPSGHSMASMSFYGLIIYFIYKKVKNPYIKWPAIILLSILILSIGISRIYLGVHYASDVIGGFCFSIAYLVCYTHFIKNEINEN